MLIFDGTTKDGRALSDHKMTPLEFLEAIGIEMPVREELVVEYNTLPDRPSAGSSMVSPGKNIVAGATGNLKGRPVFLRYANSANPNPKNPIIKDFKPRKILIRHQMVIRKSEDLELFAFLLVSPQNADSPIVGSSPIFKVIDPSKVGKKKMDDIRNANQIYSIVDTLSLEELRVKAHGLRINDTNGSIRRVYITQDMTEEEVKLAILEVAELNKGAFLEAWSRDEVKARGTFGMLMARNLIVSHSMNGVTTVSWNGVNGGAQIMRYEGAKDVIDALLGHFLQPANQQLLLDQITSATSEVGLSESLRAQGASNALSQIADASEKLSLAKLKNNLDKLEIVKGMAPEALVTFMVDNELIWHDLQTKKVHFVKKGNPGEVAFEGKTNGIKELVGEVKANPSIYQQLLEVVLKVI